MADRKENHPGRAHPRGCLRPNGWLSVVLSIPLVAVMLGTATPARAINGENDTTVHGFRSPADTCSALRGASNVQGDVILACDVDRRCQLVSLSGTQGPGATAGFCADSFPNGVRVLPSNSPLFSGQALKGTSFGSITGVTRFSGAGDAVDVLCETFTSQNATVGVRACRKIVEGPGSNCPDGGGPFKTVTNCTGIDSLLAGSLDGDPAFALFLDAATAGKPGSAALFVCTGFHTECVSDPKNPGENGVAVDHHLPFAIIEDPCIKLGGKWYC